MPFKDPAREVAWRKAYRERNRDRLRAQRIEWERRNPHKLEEYKLRKRSGAYADPAHR